MTDIGGMRSVTSCLDKRAVVQGRLEAYRSGFAFQFTLKWVSCRFGPGQSWIRRA